MYEKMWIVTNRRLSRRPFLEQIRYLAGKRPEGFILREKDLSEEEYEKLAREVLEICREKTIPCTLHFYPETARRLGCGCIHLPLWKLREEAGRLEDFYWIGASVHSCQEAVQAQELGADYVTAGHIFETDCKRGLSPRGLEFLRQICEVVSVPVYGIGGITEKNLGLVLDQGAAGGCVMSSAMQAK